jgi:2-O-methyltransferase
MANAAVKLFGKIRRKILFNNRYLAKAHGVIHVGANTGQERDEYARYGLNVAWIEPIPSVFNVLKSNVSGFPKQAAYQRLIASRDGEKHKLHISNNGGASSSILELAAHRDVWPDVAFTGSIELEAVTLPSFIHEEHLDLNNFDVLVLDTQGAELLILQGSAEILPRFRHLKVEVADFESYEGCCQLPELDAFMTTQGFKAKSKDAFAESPNGGRYYDVLYERC